MGFASMAVTVALLMLASAGPAAACTGDCNADGRVTIDELVQAVGIALGVTAASVCPAADADSNDEVTIDELVSSVTAGLDGCPPPAPTETLTAAAATPTGVMTTPTPPPAPTNTPTPTSGPFLRFCDLPGSLQYTEGGKVLVPGGPSEAPDLSWLELPVGFCAHYYGRIGNARQLRFAPGGELFVASPVTLTTGGRGDQGRREIVILPDDDRDGSADGVITFLDELPSTQGMLFANGYFYYQDRTRIVRRPYAAGERAPSEPLEEVVDIGTATGRFQDRLHWPKMLDIADDGTIYVTNGGDQSESCDLSRPFRGGIFKIDGTPGGAPVAKGFRNPITVRCARGFNRCFAIELAKDYTAALGGREKLVPVREGDDWGHPCCATANQPYPGLNPAPDCSAIGREGGAFVIGHTPFDLDFETGKWPPPWNNRAYVPMHGVFATWEGARVVSIGMDPITGEVIMGSELPADDPGSLLEFASGWDDGRKAGGPQGRPANVTFAPDGRLFLGNDNTGDIIWIAPLGL